MISGRRTAAATSRDSLPTTGFGVPAGASRPTQVPPTTGTPDSISVGISGATATRFSEAMPSDLILPARTCGSIEAGVSIIMLIWPPIRSCSAGAVPLYGTCTILIPVVDISNSVVRCAAAPMPLDANVSCPGLAFASSTRSFTEFAASELVAHTISGAVAISDTCSKLLTESYGSFEYSVWFAACAAITVPRV